MKAVIMAGGKGTRISSIASNIPKPMIRIGDKPVLEHQIEVLKNQGVSEFIITVSHLGQVIMDYFGDGSRISPATGKPFGVKIRYFNEDTPLGNAGALFYLADDLSDDFLLLNGDLMFDIDLSRFLAFHREHGGIVTLFAHPNSHPYDSGLLITEKDGEVTRWLSKEEKRPEYFENLVNAGIHLVSPKIFPLVSAKHTEYAGGPKIDLDRDLIRPLVTEHNVYAYKSPEYVRDMGTPDRYEAVSADWKAGIITGKNLARKQRAIFLDRDGTMNKYVGFLTSPDQMELLPGVSDAINEIHKNGYLAIVITNQPVIARGDVTWDELQQIHNKMEMLLSKDGAYIDDIFICPHHPDRGFEGEIPEFKVICNCRKPNPGLLYQAAEKYNIDLKNSWMIGDSPSDAKAGLAAGCTGIQLGECTLQETVHSIFWKRPRYCGFQTK